MSFDARIAVGLRALHCALASKNRRLCESHRVSLLRDTLFHCRDDDAFCDAVLSFVGGSYAHPVEAGQGLLDFLSSTGADIRASAAGIEAALATIESESVEKYAWQQRKDING